MFHDFIYQPVRVELLDLHKPLIEGDYLRVHHSPKRFPIINYYDWGKYVDKKILTKKKSNKDDDEEEEENDSQLLYGTHSHTSLPGVIVSEDLDAGYVIVNKPPGLPVHPTVGKDYYFFKTAKR